VHFPCPFMLCFCVFPMFAIALGHIVQRDYSRFPRVLVRFFTIPLLRFKRQLPNVSLSFGRLVPPTTGEISCLKIGTSCLSLSHFPGMFDVSFPPEPWSLCGFTPSLGLVFPPQTLCRPFHVYFLFFPVPVLCSLIH